MMLKLQVYQILCFQYEGLTLISVGVPSYAVVFSSVCNDILIALMLYKYKM